MDNSPERKFEPWNGKGNGNGSGNGEKRIEENPGEMRRSDLGVLRSKVRELKDKIDELIQLSSDGKKIGEGGPEDINRELIKMGEELIEFEEVLRIIESNMKN